MGKIVKVSGPLVVPTRTTSAMLATLPWESEKSTSFKVSPSEKSLIEWSDRSYK